MACGEERHELVDKVLVGEAARLHGDGEHVNVGTLALGQPGALRLDQLVRHLLHQRDAAIQLAVALHWQSPHQPEREKQPEPFCAGMLAARLLLEDQPIRCAELVVGIGHRVEVFAAASAADQIQRGTADPVARLQNRALLSVVARRAYRRRHDLDQLARLGPEDGVEVFDVAERERGHQGFALSLCIVQ